MAVAALLLWLCTAAIGTYLLVTAVHASGSLAPETADPVPVPSAAPTPPAKPVRSKDRFDPPSLQRAKNEPVPGLRALAEFTHPALAMIGLGIWLGYVVSRDERYAEVGLGVLLGTICAGVSWFIANTRAAKRTATPDAATPDAAPATALKAAAPLVASSRVLTLHAIGAAVTLLFAILIAVHA
jgi:hypothetical protein